MAKKDLPDVISGYEEFLRDLKESIGHAQVRAGLSVNRELIKLYWQIGRRILEQQHEQGWGAKVIDRLARDLRKSFPDVRGFSTRNLKYMRAFAEAYPDLEIVQTLSAQITWSHNCALLDRVKDVTERRWYIAQTIQYGWSYAVLIHQIESALYKRQGRATTNFVETLPKPQSELAQQILKDPYNFDFLCIGSDALERDLEKALVEKLRDFLLELGAGFAFVGSQYHLSVGDRDFYIDLLFFHWKLNCFVVVELKVTDFEPEYVGQLGFYLAAIDRQVKEPHHQPTIGLLLCKTADRIVAEYALSNSKNPMGVSEYKLLPKEIRDDLPAIEKLERELPIRFGNIVQTAPKVQSQMTGTVSWPDENTEEPVNS